MSIGLDPALTVDQVLERWPAAASVFLRRSMACIGCSMVPFDTVAEAAAVYGVALAALLAELRETSRVDLRPPSKREG